METVLDGHELHYFEPTSDPDFALPKSFEGTSGGAVWRFYVVEKGDGKTELIDRRLVGVPFYQSPTESGSREIICHGPRGIYGTLIDKIKAKWPSESEPVKVAL